MLDYQLFGLNPGMYHMTNVFFHILNTILLFLGLKWMTGSVWRSAFVASAFAVHPINVDSVAWIAERKNLLSTTFWMLTMITYFYYSRRPNVGRYLLTFTAFCLCSLSKSTLITLPFVLLLFDYWPLGRLIIPQLNEGKAKWSSFYRGSLRLLLEKVPMIILSLALISLTVLSLKYSKQIDEFHGIPMDLRIKNALVSYIVYFGKMVWPSNLSIFHPFPDLIPMWQVLSSIVVLLMITAFALMKYRKYPYFIVGWLWFLGTLVPVLGIIQAGLWPAIGERWAYIPYIGLFIIVAWGVPDLLTRLPRRRDIMLVAAAFILILLAVRTWFQIGYWKDDFSLFSECIANNPDNYVAHVNIAAAYAMRDNPEKAIHHFEEALRIHSNDVVALDGLARLYNKLEQFDRSINYYSEELRYNPKDIKANFELGTVYAAKGDTESAVKQFSYVIALDPKHADAYYNLGVVSAKRGEVNKAVEYLSSALKIKPEDAVVHNTLGVVLMNQGRVNDAVAHFKEALRIDPNNVETQKYLATASRYASKVDDDIAKLEKIRLGQPDNPDALQKLAVLYTYRGEHVKAIGILLRLVKIQPGNPNGYYNVACIYAKTGKIEESVEWLKKSLDKGFKNWKLLKTDKDLENIRNTPFYKELMQKNTGI
jgi:tetratricopeptide (TPR) repeat protein